MGKIFFAVFPALSNRNYRLYFSGQVVSLIGTWLQIVAQGWLVLTLTNSAFQVGLVTAVGLSPMLVFSLFGGVIVDRFSKQRILLLTQSASAVLALILGILTILKMVTVWQIAVLAFLVGCIHAIDSPARQSFVVEMVGKKDLASAIALNSGTFNAARVIGPSIAGLLIAQIGIGGTFIINGISYIAAILALLFIRIRGFVQEHHAHPLRTIEQGITYVVSHETIGTLLLFTGVASIFGWSYTTIMPVVARDIFHTGADGLGALLAAVFVSAFSKRISAPIFIIGGSMLFSISFTLFSFTKTFGPALFLLFMAGAGLLFYFSMMNTAIQHAVEHKFRGRVMSIYTIMFVGMMPIGSFLIGFASEHLGVDVAIRIFGFILIAKSMLLFLIREKLKMPGTQ